jgi:plasmid stabilization system protein ParE
VKLFFEPAASAEAAEAVRWYLTAAGPAMADAFEFELDRAMRLLLRFPALGSIGRRGIRRMRLDRFPYTVHYRFDDEGVRVLAVAHQRRRPGYWHRR